MLRVILVDDEPLARRGLRDLLAARPEVEVAGEADCVEASRTLIEAVRPDGIFLDVRMPEADGFELLSSLKECPPVIFVTAYSEYAVRAFEVQAVDYLLKPFKPARLRQALERARAQLAKKDSDPTARLLALLEARTQESAPAAEPVHVTRFAVRDRDRTRFVKVTDIDWIEASGNYVVIHAGKENFVLRETLAAVESQVSPKEFFRLNRSAVARLDRVREVEPAFNDEHVVVLTTGARLPLTRGVRELQERLKFA